MVAPIVFLVSFALQLPPARPAAQSQPRGGTTSSAYLVGPGDVLDFSVVDQAELTRATTVQHDGTVTLPLIGDMQVAGLTIAQIRQNLTARLAKDFIVNPVVDVRVRDYGSQFVLVLGEVVSPGRRPLRGNTRVIDVLIECGGFKSSGSNDLVIQRTDGTFADGSQTLKFRLGAGSGLSDVDRRAAETVLKNGDVVTALPKYYVIVEGEVGRQDRVAIENDLTLLGVLAQSGGLGKFGSSKVRVIREAEQAQIDSEGFKPCSSKDSSAAAAVCREINIKDVRKGKTADIKMLPNDKVIVSRRKF